ncbi:uncharacterized protein LOC124355230 [Homalodisca vitripennis]|uniref:uncharacterized protein LOC124355230 n=1 Tax=Homalodisca vitripennis TaxID=197043 RepID=UPI001EEC9B13|nr:uncharacterized protein LOC124355230 [Homalodisca vitripennis]
MTVSNKDNSASFTALQLSMTTLQTSLDGVRAKLVAVEEENVKIKEECHKLMGANEKLSRRVSDLQWEVMEMEQHAKLQNLEIRGIPVTAGEDVYMVLREVARALKVRYEQRDISIAHRLPQPRNKKFPPTIIVQFVNRTTKAEWLAAVKTNRLQTTDVLATFAPAPVFINEHLTKHNRELLRQAKSLVRSGSLAYAWVKEGKVFVRKTQDSYAIRIFWSLDEIDVRTPPMSEMTNMPVVAAPVDNLP